MALVPSAGASPSEWRLASYATGSPKSRPRWSTGTSSVRIAALTRITLARTTPPHGVQAGAGLSSGSAAPLWLTAGNVTLHPAAFPGTKVGVNPTAPGAAPSYGHKP